VVDQSAEVQECGHRSLGSSTSYHSTTLELRPTGFISFPSFSTDNFLHVI
jgi:hypothetical protein